MTATAGERRTLRMALAELGPLRWVIVATAVLPTIGLFVVLAWIAELANVSPHELTIGVPAFAFAIAVVTGAVLLPPGVAAVAAGYCLGAAGGGAAAALGTACGAVIGQRLVWPLARAQLFDFMRPRARVLAVQQIAQDVRGVAVLRLGAPLPFAVVNLLTSVAELPVRRVFAGTLLGAVPPTFLAAAAGAGWRRWRDTGVWPPGATIAAFVVGAALTAFAVAVARRAWRRALAAT